MSKQVRRTPIPLLLPEFDRVESPYIEPGLLPVFRLAIELQMVLQFVSLGVLTLIAPTLNLRPLVWWALVWLLILAYLCWPKLPHKLGRAYLPLALVTVSIVHIVERASYIRMQIYQATPQFIEKDIIGIGWHLLFVLLIPLILIAWQYDVRWVLVFSIGTTLLNQAVAFWFSQGRSLREPEMVELSLIGAVIFTIVGYIIVQMMDAQRAQRQALVAANTQLVKYTATAEQLAVSRERNRLARDLHDTLAHTLSAVSVQLEAVDSAWEQTPAQARALLIKALATARSGLAETRRAVQALRASPLDDLGLALAIRNLAESTAARTGAALKLKIDEELSLASELEQDIYRIAQEALANVAEHAKARQIAVDFEQQAETVELVITDDGLGFDINKLERVGHYGLPGMRERAKLRGADLSIMSQPGRGTTVRLAIPKQRGEQKVDSPRPL